LHKEFNQCNLLQERKAISSSDTAILHTNGPDGSGTIVHAEYGGSRDNFEQDMISRIEQALKKQKQGD